MPAEKLPDPTGKAVIIIAGAHAGEEGICLGTAGEEGLFAVSPTASTGILRLRFDEEFGILANAGQKSGSN